jgi:hypothetical protein
VSVVNRTSGVRCKRLVFVLVISIVSAAGLFAIPPYESFVIDVFVEGEHGLKLVDPSVRNPTTIPAFEQTNEVSAFYFTDASYSSQHTVSKLLAYSTSTTGYDISLSASAMKTDTSNPSYIKYTVIAGGAMLTTPKSGDIVVAANTVVSKTSLNSIDFYHTDIKVTVDSTDYVESRSGAYQGTIRFELISN